jgi:2-dehydro-3-deoxy-D-gluconate 5-dehydrogenase
MSKNDFLPLKELLNLTNKKAMVTGGAMGIGFAIARRLAEAGASVVIADFDFESGGRAVGEFKSLGYQVHFARCDVAKEDEVKKTIDYAVEVMGGVDILVNNAGIYPRKPISDMDINDFERVIAVNLTGAFLCSKYASDRMVAQGSGGCIINIASIEAIHPASTGMAAYDASKGGLLMLTKAFARELGTNSIRVNAIAPGAIMTRGVTSQMGGTFSPEQQKEQLKELKSFMSRMVLGHMGEADDIARVALFLASEMSSYITGELIIADGGYLIA